MKRTEIVSVFQKRAFGLALTIGAASFVMAQQKVNVTGNVKDANGGIGYSSITFKNIQNAQLSDAVLADADGNYKLELTPGNYEVSIEAVDYKKFTKTVAITKAGAIAPFVIVSDGKANLDNTTDIQAVVITATTKPYKVELDKKTYDPSQDIVSKGGSLQDVLSNVPSVEVDTDGTVSMRGSSNVKFLINGKPSALLGIDDGANALQSIPADQIEKIEVITNPSSKFEASGTAGILNIILKKSKKTGFNGSVIGTLGYQPRTNLNANLSWKKNNWTWFLNGGGGYTESTRTNRNSNLNYDRNQLFQLLKSDQETKNKNYGKNYNATAGFIYDINEKNSVNLSGTVRTFEEESNGTINYNYLYNAPFSNPYTLRTSNGNNSNLAFQGDLGWDHKFDDKGQNLSVSLSVQSNKSNNTTGIYQESDFIIKKDTEGNTIDILPDMNYELSNNSQYSRKKSLIGKLDYELPLGENSKLEAGYRADINDNFYDNTANQALGLDVSFTPLTKFTNVTNYDEFFNAIYLQFRSKIGKLGYQLGLRDELSNVTVDYHNLEGSKSIDNKKKTYNNLFPSVFLSYEVAKDNQFLLNYSRRIDRPRSFFLVPYFSITDNQNLFLGNVDLNPSYVDSFELGYSISKKKFTLNPTLFYKRTTDDDKTVSYQEDERTNVYFTTPINLGTNEQYGLDFNGSADLFPWFKIMGSISLFGYKTTGVYSYLTTDVEGNENQTRTQPYDGNGFSARARLNTTFKVDKTLSLQLQGFYRGPQNTASEDRKAMYALNMGASKTIWKGDGTISFNIQDIFNTRSMKRTTYLPTGVRESYMQWQPRQASISLTYRFKQGEKIEQPKKKKDINANDSGDDQQPPM